MSNGYCQTQCQSNYAFGIVQGKNCWCSNLAPADTTSTTSCSDKCPGYPIELCGSVGNNLFGYIALNKQPSGTQGGSGSAATSASQETTPSPTTTSSPTSSTWTPTPIVTVETITGQARTVTITPTVSPDSKQVQPSKSGFWGNKGAVAAVFTIVALAILALLLGALFICVRRRRQEYDSGAFSPQEKGSSPTGQPSRTGSLASMGLMTNLKSAAFPEPYGEPIVRPGPDGRNSYLKPVDQRLNGQLFMGDNSSRQSVKSLVDSQDYSRRVLTLANPDP
jgi:hypothetical protein